MENINKKFKGVIFDLDGTLTNTIEDITDAINYSLSKNKLPNVTISEAKYLVGNGAKVLIERMMKHVITNLDSFSKEEYDKLYNSLYEDYMFSYNLWKYNHTVPYESVVKTLHTLKRKGIKLAVLSNKPERDTAGVVEKFFSGIFDVVRGGREGVPLKPNPTVVFEVVKELGLSNDEVIYCGDSDVDMVTSVNAGLFGVGACYGFRTKKELVESGAKATINSCYDILRLFDDEPNGILLIDKPLGMSSQEAVTKVKRALKLTKIGHAGTLDPLATGLLVVLLGDSTKLANYLLEDDKEYIGEITIGERTSTLDKEGEVLETKVVSKDAFTEEEIDKILNSLIGKINMKVPMHSAIKYHGAKLYELAREGIEVDVPVKENEVFSIKRISDLQYVDDKLKFSFACHVSKGTYIRSLCEEIGNRMGFPAFMSGLRRVSAGKYNINDALTLDDVKNNFDESKVINALDALDKYKVVEVNEYLSNRVNNGMMIRVDAEDDLIFVTHQNKLIGIYEKTNEEKVNNKTSYKARRVWKTNI